MHDINPELLKTFAEEFEGNLRKLRSLLDDGGGKTVYENGESEIWSIVHNLKGVAGMVDASSIAQAAELFLNAIGRGKIRKDLTIRDFRVEAEPFLEALDEMRARVKDGSLAGCEEIWERLRKRVSLPDEAQAESHADLSVQLRDLFLSEANDFLASLQEALGALARDPENVSERNNLYRHLINIKGSAGLIDRPEIPEVLGRLTGVLERLESQDRRFSPDLQRLFEAGLDTLERMFADFEKGAPDLSAYRERFEDRFQMLAPDFSLPETSAAPRTEAAQTEGDAEGDGEADFSGLLDFGMDNRDFRNILRNTFRLEGAEHLAELGNLLLEVEGGERGDEQVHALFRVVHTLKGAAATVGFQDLADCAHLLEDVLDEWRSRSLPISDALLILLYDVERGLRNLLDHPDKDPEMVERLKQRIAEFQQEKTPDSENDGESAAGSETDIARSSQMIEVPTETAADAPADAPVLRVELGQLDGLMNAISELNSYRLKQDELAAQFSEMSKKLRWERKNLTKIVGAFQRKYMWELPQVGSGGAGMEEFSELEFDSYSELAIFARNLEEVEFKISLVLQRMEALMLNFSEESHSFSTLTSSIQDEMIGMRMTRVDDLFRGVKFKALNLARSLGKRVQMEFEGGHTELDKAILTGIGEPLMHIVRNCLDHGIESAEERERLGKPPRGSIRLFAGQEERNVVLTVADDGRGIDPREIEEAALRTGRFTRENLEERSDEEILNLIFYPQISTREKAGAVSGRGVGMDIVRHAIGSMYGSVKVESRIGEGTRFTINLPLTLALQPVLTVDCGSQRFNIPMNYVELILEPDKVMPVWPDRDSILFHGEHTPLRWLSNFLRINTYQDLSGCPVVILQNGNRRLALVVDAVTNREEVIVRPKSALFDTCGHLAGSTISPKGDVLLVLSVPYLFELTGNLPALVPDGRENRQEVRVLVADDSLSVRQTLKMMLQKHGMKVNTAKDGLLAWQKLHGLKPDLMLVDLEMPNLNGLELMTRVRESAEFGEMPMVVLTSRGGEKHRQKSMEAGANDFLSKPVLERNLISSVRQHLPPYLRTLMDEFDPTLDG